MSAPGLISVAVADDDESACRALSRLLRAEGLQPVCYPSAEAFADSRQPVSDRLVLGVELGGMSGTALHRLVWSATASDRGGDDGDDSRR